MQSRKDEEGYTPLHLAVIAGNKPVIRWMLFSYCYFDFINDTKYYSNWIDFKNNCLAWLMVNCKQTQRRLLSTLTSLDNNGRAALIA